MGISRERASSALDGCSEITNYRRGILRSFLARLTDVQLRAMQIDDNACHDEIVGFLDNEANLGDALDPCFFHSLEFSHSHHYAYLKERSSLQPPVLQEVRQRLAVCTEPVAQHLRHLS